MPLSDIDAWKNASIVLAVVTSALFIIPNAIAAWASWIALREGTHRVTYLKTRLEMTKLRYEIEVIRKVNELPHLVEMPDLGLFASKEISTPGAAPAASTPHLAVAPSMWQRAYRAYPRVTTFILYVIQIWLWAFEASLILLAIAMVAVSPGEMAAWVASGLISLFNGILILTSLSIRREMNGFAAFRE